jgi:aldehyde oxidoreductase
MRFRNAVRPGDELPNGQVAGPDTALEECLLAIKEEYEGAAGPVGLACGFKNTGLGVGSRDIGRCRLVIAEDRVVVMTGAACIGQGLATVLAQVAGSVLGIGTELIEVALPDTASTPDSGTTTASRQTLVTGEACRRACEAAALALRARGGGQSSPNEGQSFPYAELAGSEFRGEYFAETDPFDSVKTNPVLHVAYSYACHLVVLGPDGRLLRVVAAHDSGLVVNPQAFEGQVEGGVVMGLGYALTEDLSLVDCAPPAKFGKLGLLRATDIPPIRTIIVRKVGRGGALDGGVTGAAYGAKGIGEISTIPTAAAVGLAYFAMDGKHRTRLPLAGTPYRSKDTPA